MRWRRWLAGMMMLVAAMLVAPRTVQACPAWADAIEASSSLEEPNNFPEAMNHSIYTMIAVPYLSLAVIGFLIYRGCKKNMAYREALARAAVQPPSDDIGGRPLAG